MIRIALANKSTLVTDQDIINVAAALNRQVRQDFASAWSINAAVHPVSKGQIPPTGYWILEVLDESDVQGALGYHEFTAGAPSGKVFAKTCKDAGVTWSSCASHECLEILGDQFGSRCALDDQTGKLYSYEVCDAVEQQTYTNHVFTDVTVSNFVFPSYFAAGSTGPFDQLGTLSAPFSLAPGGSYMETLDISQSQGWQQITARSRQVHKVRNGNTS